MTSPGFGTPPVPPEAAGGPGALAGGSSRSWRPYAPSSRDVLAAIVVAIAMVIAGVPLGLIWAATTPRLNVSEAFPPSLVISESAFNTQAGADVHFALTALIFGVLAGGLVGWRGRRSSWPLPVALAVGGGAGSLVAAQVGHLRASNQVLDQLPDNIRSQVSGVTDFVLRSHGFHVVFPLAALLTYVIIVMVTTRAEPLALPDAPEPERYWSVPR